MYKAVLLVHAVQDIKEASKWYNSRQQHLGRRFIQEIRAKILFLRRNPKVLALRYENVRCAILDNFPFMIHFTIDESKKSVIILAVFHTSMSPEHWKRKR